MSEPLDSIEMAYAAAVGPDAQNGRGKAMIADHLHAALAAISAPEAQREGEDDAAASGAVPSPAKALAYFAGLDATAPPEGQRLGDWLAAVTQARAALRSEPQREGLAGRLAELSANAPTRDIGFVGPVNGMNERDPAGSYIRVVLFNREQREEYRISRGAAEAAVDELEAALALHATSQPLPQEGGDARLWWFLTILNGMGGRASASDYPENWLNTFCDDRQGKTDTFNLAINLGLTESSHDSDTDGSSVWLTKAGKTWLAERSAAPQPPTPSAAPDALAALKEALSILGMHHRWHLAQTDADEHGIVPSDAYAESGMCDQTTAALASIRAAIAQAETGKAGTLEDRIARDMATSPEPSRQGVEAMRNALEPFVREAKRIFAVETDGEISDNVQIWQSGSTNITRSQITYGDLRRAVAALSTPSTGSAER